MLSLYHVVLVTINGRPRLLLHSSQHSLHRCFPPALFHPPALRCHCPHTYWTDNLSQERAQPLKGLQITYRGHRGVSKFIPPITAMAPRGIAMVTEGQGGQGCVFRSVI